MTAPRPTTRRVTARRDASRAGLLAGLLAAHGATAAPAIEEIVVTGELRETELLSVPTSVTVIDDRALEARGTTHLEDILALAPNVNAAKGASRSRFFQIRGIGERGQFIEPINTSVGVVVDGVDLSGAATAATLFDVDQVEIFRGPQGTLYGANAHAGLVVVRTRAPTAEPEGRIELEAGNYDTWRAAAIASGPLAGERLTGRLAVQQYRSDGYIDNDFLNREDTAERDELTARGRLRWVISDRITADASLSRVEIDNGYDGFSFDNDLDTLSDEPGRDEQYSTLASLNVDAATGLGFDLEFIGGWSDSEIDYGFDLDWVFTGFDPLGYSATDRYLRDRDTRSLELRAVSDADGRLFGGTTGWVVGLYDHERSVDLTRSTELLADVFTSAFDTHRSAIFGQLEADVTPRLGLIGGLRWEQRDADYEDSAGVVFDPEEKLWGGRVGVEWSFTADAMTYATVSRGYKAGGFNADGTLPGSLREYDSEHVWNYELGLKGRLADGAVTARVAVFLMDRADQQVSVSRSRLNPDGSTEFIEFVDNAAEGRNYGLEAEFDWQLGERLRLAGSLGLLDTEFEDFVNAAGEDLSGRAQAHAPNYQFHLAADYRFGRGLFARVELEGSDAYYWSDSHAARARGYELVGARLGWESDRFEVALWGRNLTDERYGVRGFFFGNDPRDLYAPEEYVQIGAPRTFGITTRLHL